LHYDADNAFRILVKIIEGCGTGAPELGIFPGAEAQIKNQEEPEAELSLNSRTGVGAMAI